jgi:hypothetical protein
MYMYARSQLFHNNVMALLETTALGGPGTVWGGVPVIGDCAQRRSQLALLMQAPRKTACIAATVLGKTNQEKWGWGGC